MSELLVKNNNKPIRRSKFRLVMGKKYFTLLRYAMWYLHGSRFARKHSHELLEHVCFIHKSTLLRQLKDVDMRYQHNKIINLRIAADKLDRILLRPGETLSFWKNIGKPTASKGYAEGIVLFCGTFGTGIGGGLCQLSNRIYWMTLHTPLTVTERYRHSYDVFPDSNRTVPFGSGATCVYPYRDLMIFNGTDDIFQLHLNVGDTYLEGEWRSEKPARYKYKIIERNHIAQRILGRIYSS